MFDISQVRSQFPAISRSDFLYADNAGGSQCLASVVERISDYLLHTNVQFGADYSVSVSSTARVAEGAEAVRELFNAASVDEVAFGSSSTILIENLARAIEGDAQEDQEIIITGEHESNAGPWKKLAARRGLVVKYWHATQISSAPSNPYSLSLQPETVLPLITAKTRLVAFTACSNILGSVVPVKEFTRAIRAKAKEVGAPKLEICIDCVAYAPHRRMNVVDWDVDYCYFSVYKVYGPHTAALYARAASLQSSLSALTHHFLKVNSVSYKLQPGGSGYELVYGCSAIPAYLRSLSPSGSLDEAFDLMTQYVKGLMEPLLAYLKSQEGRGVRIVGEETANDARLPTISFVVIGERPMRSCDVVRVFDEKGGVGIRYGNFYAYTLIDSLRPKVDVDDAVVRISFLHYNTVEEVEKIIEILKEILV